MSSSTATRLLHRSIRNTPRALIKLTPARRFHPISFRSAVIGSPARSISTSRAFRAGIMPESETPEPPNDEATQASNVQPAQLNDEEYHELADNLINTVYEKAEALLESREDVEVEYSAGVLNIVFPPNGTYVINKQPPNKQIWLASPLSGPKRYDWVVYGESMHQKEGGGQGAWVYLRDGSRLSALLSKELGLAVDHNEEELAPQKDATA